MKNITNLVMTKAYNEVLVIDNEGCLTIELQGSIVVLRSFLGNELSKNSKEFFISTTD